MQILTVFCETTLTFLSTDFNLYTQNPNLVEDFYDLCDRSLESIPSILFNTTDMMLRITQAAIVGIQLQHREANSSIIRFLSSLLSHGHEDQREQGEFAINIISYRPALLQILQVCGQEMINQLVEAGILCNE